MSYALHVSPLPSSRISAASPALRVDLTSQPDFTVRVLAADGEGLSGRIVDASRDFPYFKEGDEVFGTLEDARHLARKPRSLSFSEAAQAVMPALTAVQMVADHGVASPAHRVLVLGADTPTGAYVTQLAKFRGSEVFSRPEARVDIVFDTLGSSAHPDVLDLIKPCGALISSACLLDPEESEERHLRSAFVRPRVSRARLGEVAHLFDAGILTWRRPQQALSALS